MNQNQIVIQVAIESESGKPQAQCGDAVSNASPVNQLFCFGSQSDRRTIRCTKMVQVQVTSEPLVAQTKFLEIIKKPIIMYTLIIVCAKPLATSADL